MQTTLRSAKKAAASPFPFPPKPKEPPSAALPSAALPPQDSRFLVGGEPP